MRDKVGVVLNRLTIGFVFAFVYNAIVGVVTSILSISLTGDLHDLIRGIEQIESIQGHWLIIWWVISTIIITVVALVILRLKKYISPYKNEKDLQVPLRITPITAIIVGSAISFLFFLLDLIMSVIVPPESITDAQTIYAAALIGDFVPLLVTLIFSIVSGFIVVGVASKTAKVKEITKDVGVSNIAALGKRITKKSSSKHTVADTLGLQPGALIHIGEKKVDKVTFDVFEYDVDNVTDKHTDDIETCFVTRNYEKLFWINVTGIHDAGVIERFGEYFGLHKLVQADIMNTDIRSKIEITDNYIFLILKMPHFDKDTGQLLIEQISLVLGKNHVLSFQEISGDVFDKIRERIRVDKGDVRQQKSDYLSYLLTDALIDNFFAVIEKIGARTETLEEELMSNPQPLTLQTIHSLKRQIMVLRKTVWPLREVIHAFERTTSSLVSAETKTYLRDAYGHTIQVMDTIESLRDVIGGMLDTYLSSVSNKMNEVMKTLTVIASIFIPITFIAGVYGTNFAYIPELAWEGSYFVMLGIMFIIVLFMTLWFKRKQWL